MATTAVIDTPLLLALTIDVSWNTRKSWTSAGSDSPRSSTWRVTSSGSDDQPVDRDERDEHRHQREERVERDPGRHQGQVVLAEALGSSSPLMP